MINGKKLYELIYKKEKVDPKTTRILDNCLNAKITNSHKEGILEDVGKVLKKHGANTILTMVVLNFFRKMFGRNSLTIRKNDNNLYNLYDNDRLIFSSNNKNLVEEKKYEIESTKKEGIIFVDNKNIEVDFSPSNKKAKDKLGNIYIQKDGKWFKENFKQELKIDKKHIKKIKDLDIFFDVVGDEIYVDESEEQRLKTLNIPFRESLTLEEQRMWQFIIKRYPNADHKFRLQKFNNLRNKVKESLKQNENILVLEKRTPFGIEKIEVKIEDGKTYLRSSWKDIKKQKWKRIEDYSLEEMKNKLNSQGYYAKEKWDEREKLNKEIIPNLRVKINDLNNKRNNLIKELDKISDEGMKKYNTRILSKWDEDLKLKFLNLEKELRSINTEIYKLESEEEKILKQPFKESFKEQKTNEEVWLNWAMNTDSQDLEELHEILKTLHRNNKLSTIRMQELKDENGQEIKDSLIDLLGNYEESGLNTSNTGSLVGQKLAGTKTPNKIKLDKTKLDDDLSIEINVLKEKLNKKRKFYI